MKLRPTIKGGFVLIVMALLVLCGWIACPERIRYREKFKTGEVIVSRVEAYRTQYGRLPNTLEDINVHESDSEGVYYQKKSEGRYIVWFGTTLGESIIYDSSARNWR